MPKQSYFNFIFSLYAPIYFLVGNRFNKSRKIQADELLATSEDGLKKLLVIGPGNGVDVIFFMDSNAELLLIEPSSKMFQVLTKNYRKLSKIQLRNEDFLDVNMEGQTFDLVLLHFVLSVTPQPKEILEKATGLLTSNGKVSIMDITPPHQKWVVSLINWFTKRTMFDLKLDVEKLIEDLGLNLYKREDLKEFKIFRRWILEK